MSRHSKLRLMLPLLLVAAFILPLSASRVADDASRPSTAATTPDSDVVTLTDSTFDSLTSSGSWLVEFYAPWCGHCKALAPVWEQAATQLRDSPVRLGKVDCTAETRVASRYGIRGYPTIKFVRDGRARPYTGGRSLADITGFAQRMSEPAVREVATEAEVDEAVGKEAVVFVLLGDDASATLHKSFNSVAFAQQGNAAFLHLANPSAAALTKYGAQAGTPSVVFLSRGQEQPERVAGDVSLDELWRWVHARRVPLVSTLSADNFDDLTSSSKRLALLVLPASFSHSPTSSSLIESLYPLARRYRDTLNIATVDGSRYQRWLQAFVDTQQGRLPALLVFADYPDTVWKPDTQPMGEADIARMLSEVMDGTRPGTGSTAWYSPQRYIRSVNRFLLQFEEWQIIAAVVVAAAAILAAVIAATTYCLTDSDAGHTAEHIAERAHAAAGRAEKELKQVAHSGAVAAKRLAKSIDRVAEQVVGDGKPVAASAAAGRKQPAHEDGEEDVEDETDEVEEEEVVDAKGPVKRAGKSGAK